MKSHVQPLNAYLGQDVYVVDYEQFFEISQLTVVYEGLKNLTH